MLLERTAASIIGYIAVLAASIIIEYICVQYIIMTLIFDICALINAVILYFVSTLVLFLNSAHCFRFQIFAGFEWARDLRAFPPATCGVSSLLLKLCSCEEQTQSESTICVLCVMVSSRAYIRAV